jgi:hypothetical protein
MTAVKRAVAAISRYLTIRIPDCCPHPDLNNDFPEEASNG